MPAPSDIVQFMSGQLFETPRLPNANFAGWTVIITGANSGLGFECAKQLVRLNVSTLILGVRNMAAGERAKQEILSGQKRATDVRVWKIDMADYASVKTFAARASDELTRLDALIANAAVSTTDRQLAERLERTLTVNVVSTFLLALLCLPALQKTASQTGKPGHLTITGSNVHCLADPNPLVQPAQGDILSSLTAKTDKTDMASRYFLSKLIVLLCTAEMSKQIPSQQGAGLGSSGPAVIVNGPSPGWCKTALFRQDDGGFMGRHMLKLIGRTAEVGARTLTSAIASGKETHGQYLSECRTRNASVWVRSAEGQKTQEKMWTEVLGILQGISPGIGKTLASEKSSSS